MLLRGLFAMMLVAVVCCPFRASAQNAYFVRGDVNQDGGLDIADAIKALGYLFNRESTTCVEAIDVNDDGQTDIADPVKLLNYLFAGPVEIRPPFPSCGPDPSSDALTCVEYRGRECVVLRIASLTPSGGPAGGGTKVTITGEGFTGDGLHATLCGVELANMRVVSDTQLEGETPTGTAGTVCDLEITTSHGNAKLFGAFAYAQPDCPTLMLPGGVPLEMVQCPAGTFMMGRYAGEQDSLSYEDYQHEVTLTRGFCLGKYEVTKRQWEAVMGTGPWYVIDEPDSPAVGVSWLDALSFVAAVNALGQGIYSLPTEAQWEYACRAGTTTRFYWDDDPTYAEIGSYAWYAGNAWNVRVCRGRWSTSPGPFVRNKVCQFVFHNQGWKEGTR